MNETAVNPYDVVFQYKNPKKEVLRICPNGNILVDGKLADDKQIVDAIRAFAQAYKEENQNE